MLVRR
jgi:hypothetical protein